MGGKSPFGTGSVILVTICGGCGSAPEVLVRGGVSADAGADQKVAAGQWVQLDASASDGSIEGIEWTQTAGPPVALSDSGAQITAFTAPEPDADTVTLVFELLVFGGGHSASDEVSVTVSRRSEPVGDEAVAEPDPEPAGEARVHVLFMCDESEAADGLWVTCEAATIDGSPLPQGNYAWEIDGTEDSGPVTTHAKRDWYFNSGGLHTVALTLSLAGMAAPALCEEARSGSEVAEFILRPLVSGLVRDAAGAGLAGVVLTAGDSGLTATTDAEGRYALSVDYDWSGVLAPRREGYVLTPVERSYTHLVGDAFDQDFVGAMVVPLPGGEGASVPAPERVNQTPTAADLSLTVVADTPQDITLVASDADGDALVFEIVSEPAHGGLSGSGPSLTYTPQQGYRGPDAFTFVARDAELTSQPAQVSLTVGDSVAGWTPPIGIPAPDFGISEAPPPLPDPWEQRVSGFCYVDNSHPDSTDTDNPNGYPARPRKTIPYDPPLQAGSVVEVRGGPYNYGSSDFIRIVAQGTASRPVFIKGVGMPRFDKKIAVFSSSGITSTYLILDGLNVFRCEIVAPAHHIVLRNSEVRGDARTGGVAIASWSSATLNDIVVFRNKIHDNGDWQAASDQDVHGVAVTARVSRTWILENEFYHNSGDGVQINAGRLADQPSTHHIYVGRNLAWENKQTGFWTKQAVDVIFSENTVRRHYPVGTSPSAWGAGMGYQYGPERVWFLYNHIYDCAYGIQAMSTSGMGSGQKSYFVGNVIHDIHHHPGYPYDPGSPWSNAGMMLVGTTDRWIVNNTIYDVDAGINGPAAGTYYMANNLIAQVAERRGNHIFLGDAAVRATSRALNNLFDADVRIRWGSSTVYALAGFQAAFPDCTRDCLAQEPMLRNPGSGDLRLQGGSPAIDRGAAADVYATFQSLYGLDISRDRDGVRRPQRGAYDIGAYELP